jgi:hypothetical protein
MASEWPLRLKTSHFRSPVCSSHVLTPHNASMNDPEAGLGQHQLGGWHCQCNFGLIIMASPPQHCPFPPPACSSHVLTLHIASLDDPGAGLRLHQLGGRAQQWLAWKLKVGRSALFLFNNLYFMNNCCKKKTIVLDRSCSQTANLRSKSYCTVRPSLYGSNHTF